MKEHKISIWNTVGFYVVGLYIFLTYIPQIAIHKLFYSDFLVLYHGAETPSLFVVFTIIFFLTTIIVVDYVMPHISIKIRQDNIKKAGSIVSNILIIIYLLSAIYFYQNFGVDFRQTTRLGDAGIIVKVLWFVRMFGEFYVFYVFASILNGNCISLKTRFKLFTVVIAWTLTITGSLHLLLVLIAMLLVFSSHKKFQKMFIKSGKKMSTIKALVISMSAIPIAIAVVFLGFSNKIGFDKTLAMFLDRELLHTLISHVALRMSTSYTSVLFMSHDYIFDLPLQLDTYMSSIDTFLNRLSSIVPIFEYPLNGLESVNRTNYLHLFVPNYLPVAGASPGLLASIFYIPVFPFNFILMALFVVLVIRSVNQYLSINANQLTLFSKLILLYFIFPLFESPLNMLTIIEPAFFYFILIVGMSYFPPLPNSQLQRAGNKVES